MNKNKSGLRIEPHATLGGWATVWDGGEEVAAFTSREGAEKAVEDFLAGRIPSLGFDDAEVLPMPRKPGAPPPSHDQLVAAYRDAKASGCDNREEQDDYVQRIYGPLLHKTRVAARRAAGVGGTAGRKPQKA